MKKTQLLNLFVSEHVETLCKNTSLKSNSLQQAEPLWKRAPARDSSGQPYHDFMMLIPGLRRYDNVIRGEIINKIADILKQYDCDIILADLNLKMNVLWVTVKPKPGLCVEIAALLHHYIPQAKLISQHRQ
ncbi:MAG: hypothetical protein OEW97_05705 [Gammaproteobacteria bacterium]|nr:hypothetical protein [Gammaproteobacteria bacterium]